MRVDAHSTETEASFGDRLPVKSVDGAISVWDSFWFMLRVIGASGAYAALLAIEASWISVRRGRSIIQYGWGTSLGSTRTMPCRRADQAVTALAVVGARQGINEVEMSVHFQAQ